MEVIIIFSNGYIKSKNKKRKKGNNYKLPTPILCYEGDQEHINQGFTERCAAVKKESLGEPTIYINMSNYYIQKSMLPINSNPKELEAVYQASMTSLSMHVFMEHKNNKLGSLDLEEASRFATRTAAPFVNKIHQLEV